VAKHRNSQGDSKQPQTALPAAEPKYAIQSFRIVEYFANDYLPQDLKRGFAVNFNVEMNFAIATDLSHIVVRPKVKSVVKETEEPLATMTAEFVFGTFNLEQFAVNNVLEVPKYFLHTLVNVAVGTIRGALFVKNLGMTYQHAIMPPMSLDELTPDGTFRLDDLGEERTIAFQNRD
jgi:hypothetical protein